MKKAPTQALFRRAQPGEAFRPGGGSLPALKDVAKIPRHTVDNNNFVYTMEDGKLARKKVELVAIQGDYAIIKKSDNKDMQIVTTILQKPLIGMRIKSNNESIELKNEQGISDNETQLPKSN